MTHKPTINLQGILLFMLISIIMAMQVMMVPAVRDLYLDFDAGIPLITLITPYTTSIIIIIILIFSIHLFIRKPNSDMLHMSNIKYKDGEMINVKELVDNKTYLLILDLVFFTVFYMSISIYLPIYSLTYIV